MSASAKVEGLEFGERVLGDLASTMTTLFCSLGDRLGLFRELARGPATSHELAARAGVQERYVREWASGLVAAEYLAYDPATRSFSLPAAQAAVLADEGGPKFMAGAHQVILEITKILAPLQDAFQNGGGVPLDRYGAEFWAGVQRMTGVAFEHKLLQQWVPAAGLEPMLREGARVADVGCGNGAAVIKLAKAFPRSSFVGFDVFGPSIERASQAARAAGVEANASFQRLDAVDALPGNYDAITLFDVVHDSRDPIALLRTVRGALRPGGVSLILEIKAHEHLEASAGDTTRLVYGFSLFHCMTQSLAVGGAGLGACGVPESALRRLCLEAGFSGVERVSEEPMDVLFKASL